MPCYSTIQTKMNNAEHLGAALAALGYRVEKSGTTIYGVKDNESIVFTKSGDAYAASGTTRNLSTIGRKYAEIGVRNWAKSKGYTIAQNDGVKMTLNRRSY